MGGKNLILFFGSRDAVAEAAEWEHLVKEKAPMFEAYTSAVPEEAAKRMGEGTVVFLVVLPDADLDALIKETGEWPVDLPVLAVTRRKEEPLPLSGEGLMRTVSLERAEEELRFLLSLLVVGQDAEGPDYSLLRRIFESAVEFIVVISEDGRVVFFNDKVPEFLGMDPEEVRKSSFWDFIDRAEWNKVKRMRERRLAGKLENDLYKTRLYNPRTGRPFWAMVSGHRITWEGRPATLNFLMPIEEQIEAEQRVKDMEAFMHDLLEHSPLGLVVLDREMKVVRVNRSLLEKLGLTAEQLKGMHLWDTEIFRNTGITEKLHLKEKGPKYNGLSAEITIQGEDGVQRDCLVNRYFSPVEESLILWFTEVTEKNEILKGLRRSEKKYRDLLENMHEGTMAIDREGRILECNAAMGTLLGYGKEGLVGRSYWDITPAFWQPLEKKILRELFDERGEKRYEKEFVRDDGSLMVSGVYAALHEDLCDGESCIWFFIRDITQEKNNEKEILERELKYRTILEYSPLPLLSEDFSKVREYLWQLGNLGVENVRLYLQSHPDVVRKMIRWVRPLEASQKALEFFEVNSTDELAEVYRKQKISDDLIRVFIEVVATFLEGHNVYEGEIISKTRSNKEKNVILRWVLVPGHELSWDMVLVSITDLTERVEYEKQLKVLSSAVNNSPASVVITDPAGTILYVNPKFTEVTGYTAEEAIGRNPRILQSGNHTKSFYKELWSTISQGKEWRGEFENKKKNGEIYWELASITGIKNEKGEIVYYVAIKEDISERKKTELELIQAKEKAEESDRLKTAFLANMSHEIRTPLNAIIGFTEMLRSEELDPDLKKEYFDIINQSSQALLKLIDDIIDVAKIEAGHVRIVPHPTDLTGFLRELHTIVQRDLSLAGKNVEVSLDIPWEEEFIVNVDSFRLKQMMMNLLNNSVKFTEQGKIVFGYRVKREDMLEFFVEDTGIGIPVDQHEVIFDRFRQADDSTTRKYGGTGLGLWITRNLVELMGGRVRLRSEPGRGSVFYLEIPLDSKVNIPVQKEPLQPAGERKVSDWRDKKILIAEDNDSNYEYLKAVISVKKAVLLRAHDGKEALEILRERDDVDLVLMDIQMPVLNGYEATRLLKKFRPTLPVVAQTAYAMSEDREKVMRAGCDEYISKPIHPRKLLDLLGKYLEEEEK